MVVRSGVLNATNVVKMLHYEHVDFFWGVHRLTAIPGIQRDMGWLDCKSFKIFKNKVEVASHVNSNMPKFELSLITAAWYFTTQD